MEVEVSLTEWHQRVVTYSDHLQQLLQTLLEEHSLVLVQQLKAITQVYLNSGKYLQWVAVVFNLEQLVQLVDYLDQDQASVVV